MAPRIVTLTLNPAIDMASSARMVHPTHKIRTFDEHVDPGDGGVNVAPVIHALVRRGDADMIALTLGAAGALLATAAGVHRMAALPGAVRSTAVLAMRFWRR